MIGPTAQQTRAFAWLNEHKPSDGSVQINDVTSMYTAINVIGPKAQELLQVTGKYNEWCLRPQFCYTEPETTWAYEVNFAGLQINKSTDWSCTWAMIHIKNSSPKPRLSPAQYSLRMQHCSLKHHPFIHSFIHSHSFICYTIHVS